MTEMTPEEAKIELDGMRIVGRLESHEQDLRAARKAEEVSATCFYGIRREGRSEIGGTGTMPVSTPIGAALQKLVIQYHLDAIAALRARREMLEKIAAGRCPA